MRTWWRQKEMGAADLQRERRKDVDAYSQSHWESQSLEAWLVAHCRLGAGSFLGFPYLFYFLLFLGLPIRQSPHLDLSPSLRKGPVPGLYRKLLCTLAASTILAVASARILAALRSFREFSRSLSPSASALMALTRSEVAWARMRACRTISPRTQGYHQVRKPETLEEGEGGG